MNKEIHNLLKIENDKTTIFTNKELKMIDDYINELEAYKYNLDRDYLRLKKEKEEVIKEIIEYLQSEKFSSNFPYEANEWQVRGSILNIVDKAYFNKLLDMLKEVK